MGLKQRELAALLQISQSTYSNYELGRSSVPILVLYKLADYYNVSVDYLIGRTKVKTPYL